VSDTLLTVTVMAYLVAMLLHAADYAFGRRGLVAKAVTRELVGAGGPPVVEENPVQPEPKRRLPVGRLAIGATGVAAAAHLATAVTRAMEANRLPWGNMYEFVIMATLIGAVAWLGIAAFYSEVRHLGLFVTLVLVLLTGIAGMVLHTPVGPLVPALDSYWFVVHIGAATLSSGLFLVGFAAAVMYLLRSGYDAGKRGGFYPFGRYVADAEAAERLAFRIHAFAFPIWTFAVAAGAIWAEAAWGRYWGWDPKETWAFISWIVYAGYLHARATPSVKRRTAAWIAIIGFATMLMNLFGVNIFFTGLHSYGGL
jgi:cytochrome c-type biogenesis protein CcsB